MSNDLYYTFSCGCRFKQCGLIPKEEDGLPSLEIDWYNLPDCDLAWEVFEQGDTTGVFQLESNLGKGWSKKLKPQSLEHLSALTSIIRPGSLNADFDGKSMTRHYVDRKNNEEEITYIHEALKEIMEDNYGIMIYQEDAMMIGAKIAGFDKKQVDVLRKSIGKKDPVIMAGLEKEFVDGCEKTGILNKEKAKEVFEWIRKSQKYSFNKCIVGETIVETKEGQKQIYDVKIGDYVLNHEEKFVEVVNKYDNGEKPVFEIETETGKKIQCTINHKFLCEDGTVRELHEILDKQLKIICEKD